MGPAGAGLQLLILLLLRWGADSHGNVGAFLNPTVQNFAQLISVFKVTEQLRHSWKMRKGRGLLCFPYLCTFGSVLSTSKHCLTLDSIVALSSEQMFTITWKSRPLYWAPTPSRAHKGTLNHHPARGVPVGPGSGPGRGLLPLPTDLVTLIGSDIMEVLCLSRAFSTSVLNFQTTERGFGCKEFIWEVITGGPWRCREVRGESGKVHYVWTTGHPWDPRSLSPRRWVFSVPCGRGCSLARGQLLTTGKSGRQQVLQTLSCRGDQGRQGGHWPTPASVILVHCLLLSTFWCLSFPLIQMGVCVFKCLFLFQQNYFHCIFMDGKKFL